MASSKKEKGVQFVRYFGPLLDALRALGGSGTPGEVVDRIATDLSLSDETQNELLKSGQSRYKNQVHWARQYLVWEGLIESSKRGVWSLTEKGRTTSISPVEAREIFLNRVRIAANQRQVKNDADAVALPPVDVGDEEAAATLPDFRSEILAILLKLPPAGFERLSKRLLREAGFSQVVVTGGTGDEGIDGYGTLELNDFVSFKVLFQCKRYQKSVSSSHVRDFRGAMAGRADKGIIITTGTFTADARREASRDGVPPIELVDGDKLVDMLRRLELGLKPVTTYEVDNAFFDEFNG